MGKGVALPLLLASKEAFKNANFNTKITPPGFLQYLLGNTKPNIINSGKDDGTGYLRDVKVRYRQRVPTGQTVDTDDCSIQAKPAYSEMTINTTLFKKYAIFFEDDEIAKFEKDALALQTIGTPPTTIVKELMEAIMEAANGVLGDINNALLALQVANFGKNAVTGSNAARTVNFAIDGTQNDLDSGMTRVMNDAMVNEFKMGNLKLVGSGLVNNYYLQQSAKSANQSGLNTSQLALPPFYFDPYASAAWGANQFGAFEQDSVQLVNICRFRGPKAGMRGADEFGTLILPLTDSLGNTIGSFEFDWQKRIITCPTEVSIGGAEPVSVGRGTVLDLMSSFYQVNVPADAYVATDRLTGNNGTLRYSATNA